MLSLNGEWDAARLNSLAVGDRHIGGALEDDSLAIGGCLLLRADIQLLKHAWHGQQESGLERLQLAGKVGDRCGVGQSDVGGNAQDFDKARKNVGQGQEQQG